MDTPTDMPHEQTALVEALLTQIAALRQQVHRQQIETARLQSMLEAHGKNSLETNIKTAEAAVRHNEEHLRLILQEMPVMLNAADQYGVFHVWNTECERVTGYSACEIVGNPNAAIMLYPDVTYREAMFREWAERGNDFRDWEITLIAKDGTPRTIAWSNISERFPVPGWFTWSIGIDITDRRNAQQALQRWNEELEDRVRERTNALIATNNELESFSYSVSHDLRAPLRAIHGYSQALLEDYGELFDTQANHYLNRICSNVQHMGELIDALLELARVARAELYREVVDLSQICHTIAAELAAQQPERRATFHISPGIQAIGDTRLLRILLENLLANAWKFSSKQPEAIITFSTQQEGTTTVYAIADNGVGFDLIYSDKLFGAFQRLHSQQEFAGTGIGLATVQQIIQRHGGRVWAYAEPNQGATFMFTLPTNSLTQ
jgi:PAS domain S-box-containing protein